MIPIVHVPAQPSEKSRELSRKLSEVIREYRNAHPGVKDLEIQQALKLAEVETGACKKTWAVIAGLLVALLAGLLAFFLAAKF